METESINGQGRVCMARPFIPTGEQTMRKTLHDINREILDLTDELLYAEDEVEETAILESLDALALVRESKLENIAYVRLQMKADTKAIDEEIKRLQARKRATENAARRLDGYVMGEMQQAGIKHHKGQLANITIAKSPVSCEVVNPEAIPEEYTENVTEVKILKSEAIRHYKSTGEILPGFHFSQKEHVRIN